MALVKCKECGKEISKDAETCPHCGKKVVSLGEALDALFDVIKSGIVLFIIAFIFFSFQCDNDKVKSHQTIGQNEYNETKSAEILKKLYENFNDIMKKDIKNIEVKVKNNNKEYSAYIYLKDKYEGIPDIYARVIVKNILDILIAEGRSPYKEKIDVSATIAQPIKGTTGQDMALVFGYALYKYYNDTIEWHEWKE